MKIVIKQIICACCFLLSTMCVFGQNNANHLYWSADKKLTVADFLIQPQSGQAMSSFAQFSIEHQVSGMNFLTKNFNKKVQNFMIPSASWIDTTNNVSQALLYQQTLFDLAEIYTRQFRKALRENRKKIATGLQIVTDLNDSIMSDLAKRRANYSQETNFAADSDSQLQWEEQIKQELLELKDFAYEK